MLTALPTYPLRSEARRQPRAPADAAFIRSLRCAHTSSSSSEIEFNVTEVFVRSEAPTSTSSMRATPGFRKPFIGDFRHDGAGSNVPDKVRGDSASCGVPRGRCCGRPSRYDPAPGGAASRPCTSRSSRPHDAIAPQPRRTCSGGVRFVFEAASRARKAGQPLLVLRMHMCRVQTPWGARSVIILCYSGKDVPSSKEEIEKFMFQILQGLMYMSNNDIFHGDLKPENLLVTNGVVKITDFGLAREVCSLSSLHGLCFYQMGMNLPPSSSFQFFQVK
ncbi:uncharacterized protein [Lolium perenne]|uniref:uncharacterized protein isoform X2 n=1 Tax=Lolium perenne TaxID=4522 RepID=UPI003A9A18D2